MIKMKFRKIGREYKPINTALVLSGGGAKGAYQVGVIKELLRREIKIDLITGSSIGAFNGALLAEFIKQGFAPNKIAECMEEVWQKVDNFLTLNCKDFLCNFFNPLYISSIFTNKIIKKVLFSYIPSDRKFFDYTSCQLSVTGTNLNKRDVKIFDFNSSENVCEVVLASMAYPVAFPAVQIAGDNYIDGGVLDNTPLKEAVLWGAEKIIVVFLTPLKEIKGDEEISNKRFTALEVIDEFLDLALNKLMYGDLVKAEKINHLIRLLNKYENKLPAYFLEEIRKLYGLKYDNSKRIINIYKIAPAEVLKPPGTMGFRQSKVLKKLILKGEKDARIVLL